MRVTTLIENSPSARQPELEAEFGLSLHLDRGHDRILFDTGASGSFSDNAARLGIRLEEVDVAVLSHHHFDHGGGLGRFLEANSRARVYLRGCVPGDHWFRAFGVLRRRIGLDPALLDAHRDRFVAVWERTEVRPGVHLLTELDHGFPRPRGNRHLWVERAGRFQRDPFDHELLVVVEGDCGLVVFSGCSHSGILNMVQAAVRHFPGVPIAAVFGGFHLIGLPGTMAGSRAEVKAIGRQMLRFEPGVVYTGHCTGQKGYRILKEVMGPSLEALTTGSSVEV
jgi:7,8-dihydropterin-6-yl-methyl-4-(beta-D-ribofuranosyl)aminobenzene 5'-phosphate synthase